MLELTHNYEGRSYEMSDAWGHIAVRVQDIHDAHYDLMNYGVEDSRWPEDNPGYAFVKGHVCHVIEIVPRD